MGVYRPGLIFLPSHAGTSEAPRQRCPSLSIPELPETVSRSQTCPEPNGPAHCDGATTRNATDLCVLQPLRRHQSHSNWNVWNTSPNPILTSRELRSCNCTSHRGSRSEVKKYIRLPSTALPAIALPALLKRYRPARRNEFRRSGCGHSIGNVRRNRQRRESRGKEAGRKV